MRNLAKGLVVAAVVAFVHSPLAQAATDSDPCNQTTPVGTTCQLTLAAIHPTQFSVGLREVQEKATKLGKKSSSDLQTYEVAHAAPLVIAPDGTFYITDGHHLAYSLIIDGETEMVATVSANWYGQSLDFWTQMESNQWVYLYDHNGQGPLMPAELPVKIADMQDDPYRSLAGDVRDAGGYEKTSAPFADFEWANFFRSRITIGATDAEYAQAVESATTLAHQSDADTLPGYVKPAADLR